MGIDKIRRSYTKGGDSKSCAKKLPNSDAVLNCPACFAVLCLDCQRHETYHHQYRAMFVLNCTVDTSSKLKCGDVSLGGSAGKKKGKNKKGSKGRKEKEPDLDENAVFNPVKCDQCDTQVAVYDNDEIYHFFNIVASYT